MDFEIPMMYVDLKLCFGSEKPILVGYSDADMVSDIYSKGSTSDYFGHFCRRSYSLVDYRNALLCLLL